MGGSFTTVNGSARSYLARLRADGSLEAAFAPAVSAAVEALALSGGTLFAGGNLIKNGSAGGAHLAAFDAKTGSDRNWAVSTNGAVRRMTVGGGSLYIAGYFGAVNGESRSMLAAVDVETGAVSAWNPAPGNGNGIAQINALHHTGSTVLVGGVFETIGGQSRTAIAEVDAVNGQATAWNAQVGTPFTGPTITTMTVDGSSLYVGGSFDAVAGQPRTSLAAVSLATGALLPWNPVLALDAYGAPGVNALAVVGNSVCVAGQFLSVGSLSVPGLAKVDKGTGAGRVWGRGTGYNVFQLTADGDQVWAAGSFALFDGETRNHLAAIDTATGKLAAWNPNAPATSDWVESGVVRLLRVAGSVVYAAGSFEQIGGAPRAGLAALDAAVGAALPWRPQIVGDVTAMSVAKGTLYVGGSFLTAVNGEPRGNLAAFDTASGSLKPWAPDAAGAQIADLLATDARVFVAARFPTMAGQERNGLAAFDPVSGDLLDWNANIDPYFFGGNIVSAMALAGGKLYLSGAFTGIAGQTRPGLAAVDAATARLSAWNPPLVGGGGAIAVSGDTVFVAVGQGGGTPPAAAVRSTSIQTGQAASLQVVAEGRVNSISASASTLYLGGAYSDVGSALQPNIAFVAT